MRKAKFYALTFCLLTAMMLFPTWGKGEGLVRITGGVGYRHFLRIGHWLADNLIKENPDLNIWLDYHRTGRGFRDSLLLLADRKAEISLVNSRSVAAMAISGRGLFDKAIPLRAIAALPHYDWSLFAVDAELGIRSFADLREKKVPLRLATGFLDGDSAVGFIALEVLKRHGIDPEEFRRWGGEFLPGGGSANRSDIRSGRANAVSQEGARGKEWEELARSRPLAFLSLEPEVARQLEDELGFGTLTVPANYYPSQDQPFRAPDFSDWLICVLEDMGEDLAYQLARIVVERREELESQYHQDPPRYSSINYPLDPVKLGRTDPVPLHPGAARYYEEKGLR